MVRLPIGWKRSVIRNTTANKEVIMDKKITAILAVIFGMMFFHIISLRTDC